MTAILETERLALRRLTPQDADNLLGIFSDAEAMRYYPATKSREETMRWIDWSIRSYHEHGFGLWAAVLKNTGAFAGQCGLVMQRNVDGCDEIEIGTLFCEASGIAVLRRRQRSRVATSPSRNWTFRIWCR